MKIDLADTTNFWIDFALIAIGIIAAGVGLLGLVNL